MTSSWWFDEQFNWLFDTNQYEVSSSGAHQISDISSTDISDPFCREINDKFCWVDDDKLSEVGEYGWHQISNISSGNKVDTDFEKLSELFLWSDDSKLPEVGEYGGYGFSDISTGNKFDPEFEKLNELFQWSDDNKLSESGGFGYSGNIFDTVFENLWVDDNELSEVGGSESNWISDFFPVNKLDLVFEKLNELFQGSDDSVLSEVGGSGNKIDPFFENFNEQFLWVDDSGITRNEFGLPADKLFDDDDDDVTDINDMLRQLTCDQPVEPARVKEEPKQEEDVYLRCRKEAIKMIDIATRLSKASKDAYSRGDHTSAKKFKLKAREAWGAAHKQNAEAASKILRIMNRKNGIMKLDLHGLHASEATDAVKKRLSMIETKSEALRASFPDGRNKGKSQCLEVITGVGKHSRGVATLPTAVRTFLAKNGYQFDAGRPGVIMVRPKFREPK